MPLTLIFSPFTGRRDNRGSKAFFVAESCGKFLLPAGGEKVPDRADEGRDSTR